MFRRSSGRAVIASVVMALSWAAPALAATVTVDLGLAGGSQSFETVQPSLGLTPLVQVVEGNAPGTLGQVVWFAGDFAIGGFAMADGRVLPIAGNVALFQRFGTTYGGDGVTTFALPDLRGRTVVGAGGSYSLGTTVGAPTVTLTVPNLPPHVHATATGPSTSTGAGVPFENMQPGLALNVEIVTEGQGTTGFVVIDAATDVDPDAQAAAGQVVPFGTAPALGALIGTTYGGDGTTTFALPDVRDRLVVGAGTGSGLTTRALGQTQGTATTALTEDQMPVHSHIDPDSGTPTGPAGGTAPISNLQPEIALRYLIAVEGIFPSRSGTTQFGVFGTPNEPYLGQVALYAGAGPAPRSWVEANGALLSIQQNSALFSLLGTTFGGDGQRTFALPDLRGRTPVGTSGSAPFFDLGEIRGSEGLFLSAANLPGHSHQVVRGDDQEPSVVPLPASALLLAAGLGLLAWQRRRRAT